MCIRHGRLHTTGVRVCGSIIRSGCRGYGTRNWDYLSRARIDVLTPSNRWESARISKAMVRQFCAFDRCAAFAHLGRVLAIAGVLSTSAAHGQLFGHHPKNAKDASSTEPAKPQHPASQPAAFTIPVEPLGFFAPGAIYQGQRDSLVSLDFLDEDHLLFTFHAPGLIRREGNPAANNGRQIRAMVLDTSRRYRKCRGSLDRPRQGPLPVDAERQSFSSARPAGSCSLAMRRWS